MKNQYLGDVGDYGKYGLLRYLALNGTRIGVNWYLTENDYSNDGNDNRYLQNDKERVYDPIVYDSMRGIAFKKNKTVAFIRESNLIPHAVFFEEKLSTNALHWREQEHERKQWHSRALSALADANLIFADPDTGTTNRVTRKGSDQYASVEELADYYRRGQDVAYYCHKARRTEAAWNRKKAEMLERVPDASLFVLTFHRGMQRSYIFAVHPCNAERYRQLIDGFLALPWGKSVCGKTAPFSEESVGKRIVLTMP